MKKKAQQSEIIYKGVPENFTTTKQTPKEEKKPASESEKTLNKQANRFIKRAVW